MSSTVNEPQLTSEEIAVIRALRRDEELAYHALAERLGIDVATAHRILAKPGYQFEELTLIRIRKGLARLNDERPTTKRRRA